MTYEQLDEYARDNSMGVSFQFDITLANARLSEDQRRQVMNMVVRLARGLAVQTGMYSEDDIDVTLSRHSSALGRRRIHVDGSDTRE